MAAHQASSSLGFSRKEHWIGLPFPSPMHEREKWREVAQCVRLFRTPWAAAYQAPLFMGFSRQSTGVRWDEWNCVVVWAFFGTAFLWDWNAILFQSCGHCWVFQICLHAECSIFTVSSSRIWNSSTGILSPPPALFIVMFPKAHLTLYSRMSGSRWVTTPSWLSGSWRSVLHSSSVHSCHLFLISSASVRSYHFCLLLGPTLHKIFPWYP